MLTSPFDLAVRVRHCSTHVIHRQPQQPRQLVAFAFRLSHMKQDDNKNNAGNEQEDDNKNNAVLSRQQTKQDDNKNNAGNEQ